MRFRSRNRGWDRQPRRPRLSRRRAADASRPYRVRGSGCGSAARSSCVQLEISRRASAGCCRRATVGVAVIDLSLCIADEDYTSSAGALDAGCRRRANRARRLLGCAYELLPPGTPASEMRPMLRLHVPRRLRAAGEPVDSAAFARERGSPRARARPGMLERDGVKEGSILLVSDLETAPEDVPAAGANGRGASRQRRSNCGSSRSDRRATPSSSRRAPRERPFAVPSEREEARRRVERGDDTSSGRLARPRGAALRRARGARTLRREARARSRRAATGDDA